MQKNHKPYYTRCPEGELIEVVCKKCSPGKIHKIEKYWLDDMEKRKEDYVCGGHLLGLDKSKEPIINHR